MLTVRTYLFVTYCGDRLNIFIMKTFIILLEKCVRNSKCFCISHMYNGFVKFVTLFTEVNSDLEVMGTYVYRRNSLNPFLISLDISRIKDNRYSMVKRI